MPEIETTGRHMRDIVADSMSAMAPASDAEPPLYRRGTEVVRPVVGQAAVEPVTVTALRGMLDRAADYVGQDAPDKDWTPRRPPQDVVADMLALAADAWPLPRLVGVATSPIYVPAGAGARLLARDGYDHDSGYLVRLDGLEGVRSDVPLADALTLLQDELLEGFPFADAGGRAHALAMLLQTFVRALIAGPTPLYVADAPAAGTGKGKLIGAVSIVSQGVEVAAGAMLADDAELEKRITAALLSGARMILLDEAHELGSPALASALTATMWRGRRLGRSETVAVPNLALWAATANNVRLTGDLPRRVIPIRLDSGVERPEYRRDFRHPRLESWARRERAALVSACLSIVQRWIDAGMPEGTATLGSYESWAAVLGGILETAGVEGFLSGREYLHGEADDEAKDWAGLLAAWRHEQGDTPATAAYVLSLARRQGLLPTLWAGHSTLAAQQRTGRALQKVRDRVFGGLRVRYAGPDSRTSSASYRVDPTLRAPGGSKETPETPDTTGALEPQDLQDRGFSGVSAPARGNPGRGFWAAQHETPEKPRSQTPTPPTPAVVSGVSGVSSRPPAARNLEADYLDAERAALQADGAGERS